MCRGQGGENEVAGAAAAAAASTTSENGHDHKTRPMPWPLDENSSHNHHNNIVQRLWNSWTYSYMSGILSQSFARSHGDGGGETTTSNHNHNSTNHVTPNSRSNSNSCTHDDIYAVPHRLESATLRRLFWTEYHKQLQLHEKPRQPEKPQNNKKQTKSPRSASTTALAKTLWILAAPTFVPAGFAQLVSIVCQVVIPLLVRHLLQQIEESDDPSSSQSISLWPSISILFILIVYGLTNHRQRHLATQAGMAMRAALLAILYEQVLLQSSTTAATTTTGTLTNLVANDTQKVYEVAQEGHLLWALPTAIVLVTACLWIVMGPVTLVGIAVLVALVPVVQGITASMLRIRNQRVVYTDQRVATTHALLAGMQVTKLNHAEGNYKRRLRRLRDEEMQLLQREAAVWATTLSVSKLSAAFAAAATFAVYVLMDESHVLTAAQSFSVFLLFAALRFPINYAGRFMGRLAQAQSSLVRLAAFLEQNHNASKNTLQQTKSNDPKQQFPELQLDGATSEDAADVDDDGTTTSRARKFHRRPPPLVVQKGSFLIGGGTSGKTTTNNRTMHSFESDRASATSSSIEVANNRDAAAAAAVDSDETIPQEKLTKAITSSSTFTVSGFDFVVEAGQVLACCGPVGSGKSTFILGLLGEASPASFHTRVETHGSLAYVPQTPFILNDTVRENILFGRPFHAAVYEKVLQACCLQTDIEQLGPARDWTEIGERGVTLSGGQKQRLSLARAAYGKPDLILMDDPLSALDAGTAKLVFQNLIKGPGAFLSEGAIVLVTHASHFLSRVDQISVIVDGQNKFLGTWNELMAFEATDIPTQRAVDHIRTSIQEAHHGEDPDTVAENHQNGPSEEDKMQALMTIEEREYGLSSWTTWLLWFKYAGGLYFICVMVILLTLDRLLYFGQEYWVARWTDGAEEPISVFGIRFPPQTDGRSAQYKYLTAYATILAVALMFNLARSEWSVTGGALAARNVYRAMLTRVLGAPMSFFETTPMGRLLNRFTYDMEIVDFVLSQNMSLLLVSASSYVSGIVVMVGIMPLSALAVIPVTAIYVFLLWYYRRTGTDLQRLDAVSRSPIQSMMTEGMDGAMTIRVLKQEEVFLEKYHRAVDKSTSALLNFVSAQRWLGCRIEIMGAVTVFIPAFIVSCWNDRLQLSSGLVGLLIVGSLNFTLALSFVIDYFAEAESAITAIERVDAMAKVPQEKARKTEASVGLDPSWPLSGTLEFENVCMRYRPNLPLALNGLSFKIPPGKTCGVVGRTGAGKSSLSVALFRLVEIDSGRILLDGVDLGTLGLSDVRGRANCMSIIPQNPFLAGSTIRECLDPFGESNDDAIIDALEAVRLRNPNKDDGETQSFELNTPIQEGGSNLSVGERQLLNLARALLTQPKLLVLDEATASIDGATDALIQHMLRTRFPGTTLLTIAHRLHTIMDNDLVLVMHNGRAAEFGHPYDLVDKHGGLFSELVDATGVESSCALRALAKARVGTTTS